MADLTLHTANRQSACWRISMYYSDSALFIRLCPDTHRCQGEGRRSSAMGVPRWPAIRVQPCVILADAKRDDSGAGVLWPAAPGARA
jgi:hypothetical protein